MPASEDVSCSLGAPNRRKDNSGEDLTVVDRLEAVIWDFNGTIIDDVELVVRSVNHQLLHRGLPELTVDRYRHIFGFPVEDYYRHIGLIAANDSMADLSTEFHRLYNVGLRDCKVYPGVVDALKRFADMSIRQFVLSAMEQALLVDALQWLGIRRFFEAAYGLAHLEADSKVARGRELLRDHRIVPESALLIGDTDHDAEVAEALGVDVVLVSRGHQTEAKLRATGRAVYGDMEGVLEAVQIWADSSKTKSGDC